MSSKGNISITSLLIGLVLFVTVIAGSLLVTQQFFSVSQYSDNYNASYYEDFSNVSDDEGLKDTIFDINDNIQSPENSVSAIDDSRSEIESSSLKALVNLKNIVPYVKRISFSLQAKLGIQPVFFQALISILGILIGVAILSALRGTSKI